MTIAEEEVPIWNTTVKARYDKEVRLFAKKSKSMALLFKRANTYFPTIEAILRKEGVPEDLKFIAVVESGLKQKMSSKNACGFWQIMPQTALYLDLTLHEEIDERLHLEKSTRAAAKLLKIYYRQFGSWSSAIAAYNIGSERLKSIMKHQNEKDFYNLFTNQETSRFLFKILAYKSIFSDPEAYGFLPTRRYGRYSLPTKKLVLKSPIPSLETWAETQNISLQDFRSLNPWIKGNSLKSISKEKPVQVWIPSSSTQLLIASTRSQ